MKVLDGPKTPTFLQNLQWITDPIGYLEAAAKTYGDIFVTPLGLNSSPIVLISHPQAVKHLFSSDTKQFTAPGELNKIFAPLLGHSSMFMLSGNSHKQRRQLLMPPFHGNRMQIYADLIRQLTKQIISELSTQKPFSAHDLMQDISLQVIIKVVFGISESDRGQQIKKALSSLTNLFQSSLAFSLLSFPSLQRDLGSWSPWGYVVRVQQQIDELLYAEIRDRREQNNPELTDILSLLISARDQDGNSITDLELRDQLVELLFAGHETTAIAMTWGLYWIHHLPEVREQLLQELDTLGDSPDSMSIVRLPYLTAVCNETLRISTPSIITFFRQVQEPVDLMGYHLEPGTVVTISPYLTHHHQDSYSEPKKFKPERFLEQQFSFYEFMPFGGGARRCIAEALAQMEMKLVLATLLSQYELALADQRPVKPQRRNTFLIPTGGVKMVLKGKRQRQKLGV